ncbi:MAG: NAD(P)H-hydrate dehydratase, partial [Candidatus Omnitrophota bacterium]
SSSSIDEKLAKEIFSLLYDKEISLDSTSSSLEDVTIRKKLERDCILLLVGMFNPFTKAMERMIEEAKKIKEFEEVVLVLTRAPLHRKIWGASFEDRLSMLKRYAEEKGYKVITSDKYLYLDILEEVKRIYPSQKVSFLLGINSLKRIFSWDYSDIPNALDNLFNESEFIVVERDKDSLASFIQANPEIREYLSKISTITLPEEYQKISSAQARMVCFNNNLLLLKKIVPEVIAEYIEENMLYRKVKSQILRDVLLDSQLFEEYKRQMFESYSVRDGKGRVIQDIVERVKSMLEAGRKVSILSVGAGQGIDLAYIKNSLNKYKGLLELVGLDVNPQMVDSAKIQDSSIMYINENVLEADMKQLEERFDIVFAINVIHEIVPELAKDKETGEINFSCIPAALRHLLRIMKSYLKENGEIIIYEGRAESIDEKDKWITVRFKNEDTQNRFLRFAQKYQPKKIVYKTQENKPNQIQMPYGDFMRAVSYYLYMYTRREEIEMEELWQYISVEDIVKILFDEGFKHIKLETFTSRRQLERWQKDMDIDGDWPDIIMYVCARLMDKTEVIDENKASLLLPTVEPDVYKNKQGKIAVLAGDVEYTGAFLLSLKSALRSGAGKVFAVGLKNCLDSLNIPDEVIKRRFDKIEDIFNFINEEGIDSILFGPGISQVEVNEEILLRLLKSFSGILVLDAGALYLAKKHLSAIRRTKASVIITPHKGEMAFLISAPSISESERISKARKFAIATNLVVVLKGSEQFPTIVVNKNGDYAVNTVGNRYMAKAGMGDVLAGIIAGIGAVKYAKESEYAKKRRKEEWLAYECAMLGVYVHSYAGDIAAEDLKDALIASDVINCVGKAFRKLRQIEQEYILRDSRKEISLKEVYRLLSCYPFFDRYLLKRLEGEGRVSNIFSIYNKRTGKPGFVLKFSPWNKQGTIWGVELLRFLKQKDRNLPIPEVVNTQEGTSLCIHSGRPAILYRYVSGVKVKKRELSENMIYEAAKWLARLHSIGWKDNFVPIFGERVYDKVGEFKGKNDRRFEKIHEAERKYERLSEKGRAEELFLEYFDFFVELMETVEREFLPLYNRLPQCVIHGDYTLENLLWSEEKTKIVLISDWDTARNEVRIFDILRAYPFYSLLDENNELDLSSFNKWLITYQKEAQKLGIGITKEEIKAVKYMFMILFAYQYQWLIRFENNELVNTNDAEYQEFIRRFITARLIVDYTWNEWEEKWEEKVSSPIQKEVLIKEFIISTKLILFLIFLTGFSLKGLLNKINKNSQDEENYSSLSDNRRNFNNCHCHSMPTTERSTLSRIFAEESGDEKIITSSPITLNKNTMKVLETIENALKRGDFKAAERNFRRIESFIPPEVKEYVLNIFGVYYGHNERFDECFEKLKKAKEVASRINDKEFLRGVEFNLNYFEAVKLFEEEKLDDAEALVKVMLEEFSKENPVELYIVLSRIYLKKKMYKEAIKIAEEALNKFKNLSNQFLAQLYINLAIGWVKEKKIKKALNYAEKAKKLSPQNPTVWICLGEIQIKLDDFDSAIRYFEQALKLGSKNLELYYNLLLLYLRKKEYKKAKIITEEM